MCHSGVGIFSLCVASFYDWFSVGEFSVSGLLCLLIEMQGGVGEGDWVCVCICVTFVVRFPF